MEGAHFFGSFVRTFWEPCLGVRLASAAHDIGPLGSNKATQFDHYLVYGINLSRAVVLEQKSRNF